MIRRLGALLLLAAFLLPAGCREDRPRPQLSAAEEELLRAKADEKIGIIITENLPALFAGVVVFDRDAFLTQSAKLDAANISVLNVFGNAAILLLNSADLPQLLKDRSVKKVYYLCRQGGLVRLEPTFEMDLMRRFGQGKGDLPVTLFIRFRDPPDEKDEKLVEAAGFEIRTRAALRWSVTGPLKRIARLLESDRIIFYEGASNGGIR